MRWITPSEKDTDNAALEERLWAAADSGIKSQKYSAPVPGLNFLRFAEIRFAVECAKLEKSATSSRSGSRLNELTASKTNTNQKT